LKIGIVSDVHCNHRGLRRALDIIGDVDELVCLGDSIFEYRFSNEVVRILRDLAIHTILGNHEEGFLGPHGARARAAEWIDPSLLGWLAERPYRRELDVGGKKLLLVHSTPWEPRGSYVFPHSSLLQRFAEADADFVFYGHTHHQLVRRIGKVLVINPGSAGDARDNSNGRQLSCAVLDTATEEVVVTDFLDTHA
jgi:putative phosphoesterase